MLLWPAVALLGFLTLTGMVIALATSSTARYDFERNRAHDRPAQSAADRNESYVHGGRSGGAADDPAASGAPVQEASASAVAVNVVTHPAGRRRAGSATAAGWWLVDRPGDDGTSGRVLAGPFPDRLEADCAALLSGGAPVGVVYGARRADGPLLRRPAPQERAWLAELGQQLSRLPEDWFQLVSDTDPLTTLVVEVAEALVEAGLPLHDCAGTEPAGGACLTPYPQDGGILVSWRGHDRMSVHLRAGAEADTAMRQTMNAAVATVLAQRGFRIESLGSTGCHLVTAGPR